MAIQYSCLENPIDRGAWRAIIHAVTKSWIQLSDKACTHMHCTAYTIFNEYHLLLLLLLRRFSRVRLCVTP